MAKKPTRGTPGREEAPGPSGPEDLPERWSAQRKMELVLRLLRGEPLDAVSRGGEGAGRPLSGHQLPQDRIGARSASNGRAPRPPRRCQSWCQYRCQSAVPDGPTPAHVVARAP